MNIKKELMWPTPVFEGNIWNDIKEDAAGILSLLSEFKNNNIENQSDKEYVTTVNGYQPNIDILTHPDKHIKNIREKIVYPLSEQYLEYYRQHTNVPENIKLDLGSWLVEYSEGTFQKEHRHDGRLFTGVLFLDVEPQKKGCGELVLSNTNVASSLYGFCSSVTTYIPLAGDLVIFPSWIPHYATVASAKRTVLVWDVEAVIQQPQQAMSW